MPSLPMKYGMVDGIYIRELQYVNVGIAILVRHGESETNVRNIVSADYNGFPLTNEGKEQAMSAAQQLSSVKANFIATSPVQRARETASIISAVKGIAEFVDPRIVESGLGTYNNRPFYDIPRMSRKELGMETWESHQERFREVFREVEGNWIMVSHEFPIRAAISMYLGFDELESYGLKIRNATISVIDLEQKKVLCIGSRYLSDRIRTHLNSKHSSTS